VWAKLQQQTQACSVNLQLVGELIAFVIIYRASLAASGVTIPMHMMTGLSYP